MPTMNTRSYQNCSVFGCLNTTLERPELTFFKLPASEERRNEWLKLIEREDLIEKPSTHCRVCEEHFDTVSILVSPNRKVLKQNTFPKLLLPNKKYENKETQVAVETSESYTQCDLVRTDVLLRTPIDLCERKRKHKNYNTECKECKKRLKTTEAESIIMNPTSLFFRLCDKYLSKKLAETVKQETKSKLYHPDNK